jgi:hypothetical protein
VGKFWVLVVSPITAWTTKLVVKGHERHLRRVVFISGVLAREVTILLPHCWFM